MADADVPITAGSGTKIDTRTVGAGTDEHRQVVVVGDPVTAAGVASADSANGLDVDVTRLPALPAGTNNIGDVDVLSLPSIPAGTNNIGDVDVVSVPSLTKGTQGSTGLTVQDLKDAGRNQTNLFMAGPTLSTGTDALMSLTGYKSGAAVTATTTPAVVTSGKTYRITSIIMTYVATATAGYVRFILRANTGGVVAIGSPAVQTWLIGAITPAQAGSSQTTTLDVPDGLEFAAGTGIGVSMVGVTAVAALGATGYGHIALHGFEY